MPPSPLNSLFAWLDALLPVYRPEAGLDLQGRKTRNYTEFLRRLAEQWDIHGEAVAAAVAPLAEQLIASGKVAGRDLPAWLEESGAHLKTICPGKALDGWIEDWRLALREFEEAPLARPPVEVLGCPQKCAVLPCPRLDFRLETPEKADVKSLLRHGGGGLWNDSLLGRVPPWLPRLAPPFDGKGLEHPSLAIELRGKLAAAWLDCLARIPASLFEFYRDLGRSPWLAVTALDDLLARLDLGNRGKTRFPGCRAPDREELAFVDWYSRKHPQDLAARLANYNLSAAGLTRRDTEKQVAPALAAVGWLLYGRLGWIEHTHAAFRDWQAGYAIQRGAAKEGDPPELLPSTGLFVALYTRALETGESALLHPVALAVRFCLEQLRPLSAALDATDAIHLKATQANAGPRKRITGAAKAARDLREARLAADCLVTDPNMTDLEVAEKTGIPHNRLCRNEQWLELRDTVRQGKPPPPGWVKDGVADGIRPEPPSEES